MKSKDKNFNFMHPCRLTVDRVGHRRHRYTWWALWDCIAGGSETHTHHTWGGGGRVRPAYSGLGNEISYCTIEKHTLGYVVMRFVFSSKLDRTVVPVRRPDLADINFTDYKFSWCGALTTYISTPIQWCTAAYLNPWKRFFLHVTVLPGQECPSHLNGGLV